MEISKLKRCKFLCNVLVNGWSLSRHTDGQKPFHSFVIVIKKRLKLLTWAPAEEKDCWGDMIANKEPKDKGGGQNN